MSSPVTRRCPPGLFIGIETSVMAPPCQTMRRSATRRWRCTVTPISVITARMSCLRSRTVVVGASKMARMSAPAVVIQASSCSVSATGRRARWAARSFSAARTAASLASRFASSATNRFSGSTLSNWRCARSASSVSSHCQLEHRQVSLVVGVGLGQGLGGGGQRGRGQHVKHLVEDPVFQPDAADALADVLPGIQLFGAGAHIAV